MSVFRVVDAGAGAGGGESLSVIAFLIRVEALPPAVRCVLFAQSSVVM